MKKKMLCIWMKAIHLYYSIVNSMLNSYWNRNKYNHVNEMAMLNNRLANEWMEKKATKIRIETKDIKNYKYRWLFKLYLKSWVWNTSGVDLHLCFFEIHIHFAHSFSDLFMSNVCFDGHVIQWKNYITLC